MESNPEHDRISGQISNPRMYAKIMRHIEKRSGTGFWDFRTLNLTHPHLAEHLFNALGDHLQDILGDQYDPNNFGVSVSRYYVPRRIWN